MVHAINLLDDRVTIGLNDDLESLHIQYSKRRSPTFQVGPDASDGGNSVQAHESGGND